MDQHDMSGIETMVQGDADRARRLRATLAVVARRTEDPELRKVVTEVLAGRRNVRQALLHPSMMSMAQKSLDNLEEGLDRLDRAQREEVLSRVGEARTPDEDIEAMREPRPTSDGRTRPDSPRRRPDGPSGGTW